MGLLELGLVWIWALGPELGLDDAHLLAGLCLPPGVGEDGPPGPVGGEHEAGEDEEDEDELRPPRPRPTHQTHQRGQHHQAQEHVNIPGIVSLILFTYFF